MLVFEKGVVAAVIYARRGFYNKKEAEEYAKEITRKLEEHGYEVVDVTVDKMLRNPDVWVPLLDVKVMSIEEWDKMYPQGYRVFGEFYKKLKEFLINEARGDVI